MIVQIDDSVVKAVESNDSGSIAFIVDLIESRKRGELLLFFKKRQYIKLIKSGFFTNKQNAVLQSDKEKSTYVNAILEGFFDFYTVYNSSFGCSVSGDYDLINYINDVYDLGKFPISRSVVVFENISDDSIYNFIVKWYFDNFIKNSDFIVCYEPIHGGGDTTSDVAKSQIEKKMCVFALCDSDKKSPFASVGKTAAKTNQVFESFKLEKRYLCIEAHEVENLIPISVHALVAVHEQKDTVDFLTKTEGYLDKSILYFDYKKSLKKSFIESEVKCGEFWRGILNGINYSVPSDEKVSVITPNLSSMMKHSVEKLINSDYSPVEGSSLYEEWVKIGGFLAPKVMAMKSVRL